MGLHNIYSFLAESNEEICRFYEKRKNENRKDFENHRIKYWMWLIIINIEYRVFHKNLSDSNQIIVEKKPKGKKEKFSLNYVSHFDLVRGIWQFHGATDELINIFKVLDQSQECWQKDNSLMWLIFISALYERGDEKEAAAILEKYIDRFGLNDIDKFLFVTEFSHKVGIYNAKINRSYGVLRVLKNNLVEEQYKAYVKDKSIAVVGNGEECLGKKKGKEIDDHDIVIRFNNYTLKRYETDYGSKTNVWIRSGNSEVICRDIRDYDFVIYESDFEHVFLPEDQLEILGQYVVSNPDKIFYWNREVRQAFMDETGIENPSSGIFAIWQLFKIRKSMEGIDFYGFSFQEETSDHIHYYDNLCRMGVCHSVRKEKELINKLLNNESDNNHSCKLYCCAYREYDINSGRTGGPGGVLMMQKEYIGEWFRNIPVEYIFKAGNISIKIDRELNGITGMIVQAAHYIINNSKIKESMENGINPLLVCHDIGCAYGAYMLGVKYVVVYHQQGSVMNEIKAAGINYSKADVDMITFVEREVLKNAYKVYFPSMGAREVFEKTSVISQRELKEINFSEYALYNTIKETRKRLNIEKVLAELDLSELYNAGKQVFISVADFNYNKGIDRIPMFLSKYVLKSGREIAWIAIGNTSNKDMYEKLSSEKDTWNFEAYLIGKRIEHEKVLELCNWADFYIMLHRNSIFDLAILEAMRAGNAVILSNSKSNYEFDKENNVLIVDFDNIDDAITQLLSKDLKVWKSKNRAVFNTYFSQEKFTDNYIRMLEEFTQKYREQEVRKSHINQQYLSEWQDKYKGKRVVICGSGSSLEYIRKQDEDCVYIALNQALFYPHIKFDIHFMQDYPRNQPYQLEDYNSYDCVKFYGIITNPQMSGMGIGASEEEFYNLKNKLSRYELEPNVLDYKTDRFNFSDPDKYLADGQSVLFSAIQFAVLAGFQIIELCGVDFSKDNYGSIANKAVYAHNVYHNLIALKKQLKLERPYITFGFMSTTNKNLHKDIYFIDHENEEIVISGIYTENYRNMVKLQEETCEDDYVFDFRYISDEQWNEQSGTGDFAFFSGNTLKTQLVIDKIRENWGKILIVADADLVFLKKTKDEILYELRDSDMLFLSERGNGQTLYERAVANINIGFVAMQCNQASLDFWVHVQQETILKKGWDQEIVNIIIQRHETDLKYKMLSENFSNGGSITRENVGKQKICTACGTIAKRKGLDKFDFLLQAYNYAKKNQWFEN